MLLTAKYRGIALSYIICKICNSVVLDLCSDKLITSELQFGFDKKRSINMYSVILNEYIAYYINSSITVYCILH